MKKKIISISLSFASVVVAICFMVMPQVSHASVDYAGAMFVVRSGTVASPGTLRDNVRLDFYSYDSSTYSGAGETRYCNSNSPNLEGPFRDIRKDSFARDLRGYVTGGDYTATRGYNNLTGKIYLGDGDVSYLGSSSAPGMGWGFGCQCNPLTVKMLIPQGYYFDRNGNGVRDSADEASTGDDWAEVPYSGFANGSTKTVTIYINQIPPPTPVLTNVSDQVIPVGDTSVSPSLSGKFTDVADGTGLVQLMWKQTKNQAGSSVTDSWHNYGTKSAESPTGSTDSSYINYYVSGSANVYGWSKSINADTLTDLDTAANGSVRSFGAGTWELALRAYSDYGDYSGWDTDTFTVKNSYTVTPSADTHCNISPTAVQTVTYGGTPSFSGSADSGYNFQGFSVDNGTTVAGSSYTFPAVTANHTIRAKCQTAATSSTLSVKTQMNGVDSGNYALPIIKTITPSQADVGPSTYLATKTFDTTSTAYSVHATTNTYSNTSLVGSVCQQGSWPAAGTTPTASIDTLSFPVGSSINEYCTFNFTTKSTLHVKTQVNGADSSTAAFPKIDGVVGTTNPMTKDYLTTTSATASVSYGTLASGYSLVGSACQAASFPNAGTTPTVTQSVSLGATLMTDWFCTYNFKLNTYTITPTADPGCNITPATVETVNSGANSATYTGTANSGYTYNGLSKDGAAPMAPSLTWSFSNVTANHTITAKCTIIPVNTPPTIKLVSPGDALVASTPDYATPDANAIGQDPKTFNLTAVATDSNLSGLKIEIMWHKDTSPNPDPDPSTKTSTCTGTQYDSSHPITASTMTKAATTGVNVVCPTTGLTANGNSPQTYWWMAVAYNSTTNLWSDITPARRLIVNPTPDFTCNVAPPSGDNPLFTTITGTPVPVIPTDSYTATIMASDKITVIAILNTTGDKLSLDYTFDGLTNNGSGKYYVTLTNNTRSKTHDCGSVIVGNTGTGGGGDVN